MNYNFKKKTYLLILLVGLFVSDIQSSSNKDAVSILEYIKIQLQNVAQSIEQNCKIDDLGGAEFCSKMFIREIINSQKALAIDYMSRFETKDPLHGKVSKFIEVYAKKEFNFLKTINQVLFPKEDIFQKFLGDLDSNLDKEIQERKLLNQKILNRDIWCSKLQHEYLEIDHVRKNNTDKKDQNDFQDKDIEKISNKNYKYLFLYLKFLIREHLDVFQEIISAKKDIKDDELIKNFFIPILKKQENDFWKPRLLNFSEFKNRVLPG